MHTLIDLFMCATAELKLFNNNNWGFICKHKSLYARKSQNNVANKQSDNLENLLKT